MGAPAGESLADRLSRSRDRGVEWLLRRIDADGKPAGADERAGWPRIPWALTLSGATEAAAAVLGWAERHALDDEGGFRAGPSRGNGMMVAYPLAHLSIGAWLAERYDISLAIMEKLRTLQQPDGGGINAGSLGPGGADLQELLVTAQVGIAALITSHDDIVDGVLEWITSLYDDQPDLPHKLFAMREGHTVLTELPSNLRWLGIVDFSVPRQTFYHPGIAAAFLAGTAMRRRDSDARSLAGKFLNLNLQGTPSQFDDVEAVQICKFGWGAATLSLADPAGNWVPQVVRMSEWFIDRQDIDGGWSPSRFLVPNPSDVDRMLKTAEHVMEVNTLLSALGAARGRSQQNLPTSLTWK